MSKLIFAHDIDEGCVLTNREILLRGNQRDSARGKTIFLPNILLVVEHPFSRFKSGLEDPGEIWKIENEDGTVDTYADRINRFDQLRAGCRLIRETPYSRRFSICILHPADIRSKTPPSLLEIYVQVIQGKVHLTAFLRSVDVFNYLKPNLLFIAATQEEICRRTSYGKGSIASFIANAHIYERDTRFAFDVDLDRFTNSESGGALLAKEIKTVSIPFGWRQTLEYVYKEGIEDKTQWGEAFAKQSRAKFCHRVLIDISNPLEEMMDDNGAPFSARYGEEYSLRYVIGRALDREVKKGDIRKERGEEYTYASRARNPIDQLHLATAKLLRNKYTRRAAVAISRPWDAVEEIMHPKMPCAREKFL